MKKPHGYENDLGIYKACIFDSWCGEAVGWGFKIINQLGDERFQALSAFGELKCCYPNWYLIVKKLTRKEAEIKYGKITNEEYGLRGGWRSVTFGEKKFDSQWLKNNEI